MESLLQDVRYGLRMMAKNPVFTIVAVITLALGIGANTAIFTLFDQVLLRRLPVRDPQELVQFRSSGADSGRINARGNNSGDYFSYPMYSDLRDQTTVFSGVLATFFTQVGLEWHNQPELVNTELVSGNYFETLGLRPALGRLFVQSDDTAQNANPLVVLSFTSWQRRFGADPGILNQTLLLNSHPFTVIGVVQPGFHSVVVGDSPDFFVPMMMKPEITPGWNDLDNHRSKWLNVFARLKPGTPAAQAEAGVNILWRGLRTEEFKTIKAHSASFKERFIDKSHLTLLGGGRGYSPLRENIRTPLLILMGMVGLVMLIACANVASLLLVRAAGRVREMSIRYALGARRGRIVRQLLIEGAMLGVVGGTLAVILAPQVSALLLRRMLADNNGQTPFSSQPDLRILVFNFGLAIVVSLLFSLAPAFQFWRPDLTPALKQQTTTVAGGGLRFRRVSVGLQIGLSLLLLVGSGLFIRTLYNLKTLDVGFSTDHLLTFGIDAKLAGYDPKDIPALFRRVEGTLAALPGVHSVAATNDPELAGNTEGKTISIGGYVAKDDENMDAEWSVVTMGYFSTLEKPVIAGRTFSEQDGPDTAKVAVINESLARHYFGGAQQAVGHFLVSSGNRDEKPDMEIVGVVGDARHEGVRNEIRRTVYVPYLQAKEAGFIPLEFYVRTWQAPQAAEATVSAAMRNLDSKLALDTMRTMDEQINDNLSTEGMIALLAASFGVLATLLAAVGLYGVLAYATVQRTREIGIRIALGASRGNVAQMVLVEVARLAGVSIALALPAALVLGRLIGSQLFGVSNYDPLTLVAVTLLVGLMALFAAWIPTRRATRVDPMVALRYE
ncbi:MAG: ABC transporter permease [Terriglobales bacterium]